MKLQFVNQFFPHVDTYIYQHTHRLVNKFALKFAIQNLPNFRIILKYHNEPRNICISYSMWLDVTNVNWYTCIMVPTNTDTLHSVTQKFTNEITINKTTKYLDQGLLISCYKHTVPNISCIIPQWLTLF